MRSVAIVGCVLLTLALSPNETFAKGKPQHAGNPSHAGGPAKLKGGGGEKNHHKAKAHIVRDVIHKRGGPPPWAPAHGYRRKHGNAGYALPFGIANGTHDPAPSGTSIRQSSRLKSQRFGGSSHQ